eukprot:6189940-Pleurochrysis_carterae.AAC.1
MSCDKTAHSHINLAKPHTSYYSSVLINRDFVLAMLVLAKASPGCFFHPKIIGKRQLRQTWRSKRRWHTSRPPKIQERRGRIHPPKVIAIIAAKSREKRSQATYSMRQRARPPGNDARSARRR